MSDPRLRIPWDLNNDHMEWLLLERDIACTYREQVAIHKMHQGCNKKSDLLQERIDAALKDSNDFMLKKKEMTATIVNEMIVNL